MLDFSTLTAAQKCRYLVLVKLNEWRRTPMPELASAETLDELYETEDSDDDGTFQDARNERRYGIEAEGIETPFSRNYEIDTHAAELPDGSWIGWWHLHGGGKHSEPEAYDWVSEAFDLNHSAEVVTVTKHTFKKVEQAAA
jgi:hypothetical protein